MSSRHAVSRNVSLFSVYGAEFNWVKFWHTIMLSRTKPWDVYDRFLILIILFCLWKKYRTWIAYQRFCLAVILFCHWKNYKTWDGLSNISESNYSVLSLKEVHNMTCIWKISFKNNSVLSLKGVQNYLISLWQAEIPVILLLIAAKIYFLKNW